MTCPDLFSRALSLPQAEFTALIYVLAGRQIAAIPASCRQNAYRSLARVEEQLGDRCVEDLRAIVNTRLAGGECVPSFRHSAHANGSVDSATCKALVLALDTQDLRSRLEHA